LNTLVILGLVVFLSICWLIAPVYAQSGDYALEFDGVSDFVAGSPWATIIGPDWQNTKL
jgi:hypothetical protein